MASCPTNAILRLFRDRGDPQHRVSSTDRRAREGERDSPERLLRPREPRPTARLRAAKVAGNCRRHPRALDVDDPDGADTLVLGWGSTHARSARPRRVRASGRSVATAHLRHLNPFLSNTGDVVCGYDKVLVPEMNLGQLRTLIRAEYVVDAGHNKVRGRLFRGGELAEAMTAMVDS